MGCDYYITKVLQMYYSETEFIEFETSRERCYFYYEILDEDDDNYDENLKSYKKSVLTPKSAPIILYINGKFNKPITEEKYKTFVEYEVTHNGKKWSDIIKIIKVEKRFERF